VHFKLPKVVQIKMPLTGILGDLTGAVADGTDLVEGAATLGIGIAASRLVRYAFKKFNLKVLIKSILLLEKQHQK